MFEGSESRSSNSNNNNHNINNSGFSGGVMERNNGCIPMEMALKGTLFKGSLIDRVASIESRLFQLCLEMESSSASHASSSSGDTSSHRCGGESSSFSFPTFNLNPNYANTRISQVQLMTTTTREIEENSESEEHNHPSALPEQKLIKKKNNNIQKKDDNSCKRKKKKTPPTWPHFKLLGC